MSKVQWTPWWWAAAGCAALLAVDRIIPLTALGWIAGVAYLLISTALLSRGLSGAPRLGAANAVTSTRSMLVGIVTAMAAASFAGSIATALFVTIASIALSLDAVDGYVARRTGTASRLGARFDMEVDAFLLLVLAAYDGPFVGWWVLAIGLMFYVFVVAGWMLPWMRATLPPRYWRKVVTAVCGIALTLVAARILPGPLDVAVPLFALLLLVESFGRDVIWLVRARRDSRVTVNRPAGDIVSSSRFE